MDDGDCGHCADDDDSDDSDGAVYFVHLFAPGWVVVITGECGSVGLSVNQWLCGRLLGRLLHTALLRSCVVCFLVG